MTDRKPRHTKNILNIVSIVWDYTGYVLVDGIGVCQDDAGNMQTAMHIINSTTPDFQDTELSMADLKNACEDDELCVAFVYSDVKKSGIVYTGGEKCDFHCDNTIWIDNSDLITSAGFGVFDTEDYQEAYCYVKSKYLKKK